MCWAQTEGQSWGWQLLQGDPPDPITHLGLLIDVFAHAFTQHNEHGHGHLHVALLRIEAQHVAHQGTEEVRRQAAVVQCV